MDPAAEGYRGLWRRRLLRDAHGEDRDSQVWWLQGAGYYVDLRQPPDRPDFSGVTGFDQCNDEQLAWLARQQGFAGQLVIDGNRLHWQRSIDLQPPAALADIGEVRWDGECLHERGVLADYAEEWLWERPTTPTSGVWVTPDGRGLRVVMGEWFMQAVDLRQPLRAGTRLNELLQTREHASAALFDCAIDFGLGQGADQPWQVLHSNLPWREDHSLMELNGAPGAWRLPLRMAPENADQR
jgi:hypothetical protein